MVVAEGVDDGDDGLDLRAEGLKLGGEDVSCEGMRQCVSGLHVWYLRAIVPMGDWQ